MHGSWGTLSNGEMKSETGSEENSRVLRLIAANLVMVEAPLLQRIGIRRTGTVIVYEGDQFFQMPTEQ